MRYFCSFKYLMTATESREALTILNTGKHQNFVYLFFLLGLPCLRDAVLSNEFSLNHYHHFAHLTTALCKLHSVPLSKVCDLRFYWITLWDSFQIFMDNRSVPLTATLSFIFLPRYLTMVSPHVRESGFRNPGIFCLRNPESWALESGIQH